MSDLEQRLKQEIDAINFSFFEWKGFQTEPELALLAGAAIGYGLGMKDAQASFDKHFKGGPGEQD